MLGLPLSLWRVGVSNSRTLTWPVTIQVSSLLFLIATLSSPCFSFHPLLCPAPSLGSHSIYSTFSDIIHAIISHSMLILSLFYSHSILLHSYFNTFMCIFWDASSSLLVYCCITLSTYSEQNKVVHGPIFKVEDFFLVYLYI